MAPTVFFLLLGIWMAELSLFGMRNAPLLGVACLVSAALCLAGYRRHAPVPTPSVLAELGRAARAKATPPRGAVRAVH